MVVKLAFSTGVGCFMRWEYLQAHRMLDQNKKDWSDNKKRLFAVRVVSVTHAAVSAILVVLSLLMNNNYIREPYDYSFYNAQFVFLWSLGYFVYDLIDMIYHGEASNSKEYIVHHSLVITAFSVIMTTGKLNGFAMIGLLVEVQTVLLHTRSLLHLAGYGKTWFFHLLVRANMTMLFLFRHIPISYLIVYMTFSDDKCPLLLKLALIGGLSFIEYHNIHLTISMFKTDGIFGGEVADLEEDDVDPLGAVRKKEEKDQ
ncbi:hypothetical protein PMAYCL1PPCAC_06955 [Pristionchus mayeri]|uniref:TLC domain-containing protein n=1 Tax=Pristionchus mayeri TaxID=1317129 RepID=A0AAN4ZFK1_9BILA|nr:hypothetical protein PMAYCL1PPCAC_06955 [Pristionchus mayeri]